MGKSFFRKEALDAAARMDDVQRTMRVTGSATRLTTAALATALAASLTWSAFVDVPIHVRGNGVLVDSDGALLSAVSSISTGYVAEIKVPRGTMVRAGQVLATLTLADREADVRKSVRMLALARKDFSKQTALRKADAEAEDASFSRQVESNTRRREALRRKANWLTKRLADLEKLHERGIVSLDVVSNAHIAADAAADDLEAAEAESAEILARLDEARSSRRRADLQAQLEMDRLAAELEAAKASLTADSTVIASVDGKLIGVNTRVGALASAGDPLFEILPRRTGRDARLEAVVFVPLSQGKRLVPGDRALLEPADLPEDIHEKLVAEVVSISDVPVSQGNLQAVFGDDDLARKILAEGPSFEVRLRLDKPDSEGSAYRWTSAKAPPVALTVGTPLTASVTVERVPLLSLAIPGLKRFLKVRDDEWTGQS